MEPANYDVWKQLTTELGHVFGKQDTILHRLLLHGILVKVLQDDAIPRSFTIRRRRWRRRWRDLLGLMFL